MKILSIVKIAMEEYSDYGYLKEIVVKRANQKEYVFKEADFPSLHLNYIEDMFLLYYQNKLYHLDINIQTHLAVALWFFIRITVLKHRVEDVQLGVESYQTKLNLVKPQVLAHGVAAIFYKPKGDELQYRLNNVQMGYSTDMSTIPWSDKDKRRAKSMNQRDLPRYILLDRTEVHKYNTKGVKVRKGIMKTEIELALEQTQQGASDEVLMSTLLIEIVDIDLDHLSTPTSVVGYGIVGYRSGWGDTLQDNLILGCLRAAVHPSQRQHMWGNLIRKRFSNCRMELLISPGQDGRLSNRHNLEDKEITALCWASSNGTVLAVGYLDEDIMFWKTSTTASGEGPNCSACFQIFDSPVQALHYVDDGAKLAVTCECGRVVVLDMDAFSVSFVYNRDHVKSPKGARLKDLDKPVNKLMFVCTKDATFSSIAIANGLVVRVLGMAELKVSLTKAYNEDNRRKKQMVHMMIILDLQSKSSAGEASTAAAAPKCCLSNVLVLKEVSHYCLGTRMICAASVYFMLLMQDLMLPVVISYVNAAIDTTAIGFKRSPGCIFTLTACTLGLGPGCIFTLTAVAKWECSSYGRALALHARGTGNGIYVVPSKIEAVKNWKVPKTPFEIRSFLGLAGDVRTLIMDEAHASRYLVHPGADKTYYDLRDMYGGHV
ncbi:synaptobrevin, WD40/YVTN repeat-like-containing domain protein [Tanacetum coccineum]